MADANNYNGKQRKTREQWLDEGNTHFYAQRYDEALAAYQQALQLDPDYAKAYNNMGYVLNEIKRYEEALAAYEQAIRLNPNYAKAYNNKAIALEHLGRTTEAQQAYDKARELGYGG